MQKLIYLDTPTGDEYQMWDIAGYVKDIDYFYENAEEVPNFIQYNQLEFYRLDKNKYPTTLCTLYWPMSALATRTQRDLTTLERQELIQLRRAESDFDDAMGGMTSRWVDVVRRWWNTRYPDNKIVSFVLDNNSELRKHIFAKNFPVVTSFRGNSAFSKDANDGIVDWTTFGKTTYWHCRTMMWMTVYDNYRPKDWRRYSYKSIDQYLEVLKNGYERPQSFIYFLENDLSQKGKKLLKYMKAWLWNGERENDMITRWEASRIAMRLNPKIKEEDIWNGKDWQKAASRYEVTTMFHRAVPEIHIYTDTDRNREISRKDTILLLP